MTDGNSIKDWIKAGEIAKEHNMKPFWGVFVQAGVDDGSVFAVIFHMDTKQPVKGGLPATHDDIEKLRNLGITIDDSEGWLEATV